MAPLTRMFSFSLACRDQAVKNTFLTCNSPSAARSSSGRVRSAAIGMQPEATGVRPRDRP